MKDNPQAIYFAVDPGALGSYVVCYDGLETIIPYNLDCIQDLLDHVLEINENHRGKIHAIVEAVPSYCGRNIPSHTAFKLGMSCGQIQGLFRALKIPMHLISPRKWQAPIAGLGKKTGHARKRIIRESASILYPNLGITIRQADSLMMAHFFFNNNTNKR